MRASTIVLLSAGLDSLASFYWALQETDVMLALTLDYGQKAAARELELSKAVCERHDVAHKVIELSWYRQFSSALIQKQSVIPDLDMGQLDELKMTQKSAQAVWVPNRNGVMIALASAFAESMLASSVVVGFNAEEGVTFPDNSPDFVKASNKALEYSTKGAVRVVAPMIDKNKTQIVEWCLKNNVDLSNLWSCYRGDDRMCGQCESCQRCKRALQDGGASTWKDRLFSPA